MPPQTPIQYRPYPTSHPPTQSHSHPSPSPSPSTPQIPTITCSSCNVEVGMDELGGHVCRPTLGGGQGQGRGQGQGQGGLGSGRGRGEGVERSPERLRSGSGNVTGSSGREADTFPSSSSHSHSHAHSRSHTSASQSQSQPQHQQQPQAHTGGTGGTHHRPSLSRSGSGAGGSGLKLDMSRLDAYGSTPTMMGSRGGGGGNGMEGGLRVDDGGGAGMAGVGRRAFTGNSPITPSYPYSTANGAPSSPHTPPHAAISTPPPNQPHIDSQNQSQPYFIASHAGGMGKGVGYGYAGNNNAGAGSGSGSSGAGHAGERGSGFVGMSGYRERAPSPLGSRPSGEMNRRPGMGDRQASGSYSQHSHSSQQYNKHGQTGDVRAGGSMGVPTRVNVNVKVPSTVSSGASSLTPILPESRTLHSPAVVPQTATSNSSLGLNDIPINMPSASVSAGAVTATTNPLTGTSGGTQSAARSGGGVKWPRPEVSPEEFGRMEVERKRSLREVERERQRTVTSGVADRARERQRSSRAGRESRDEPRVVGSVSPAYQLEDRYAPDAVERPAERKKVLRVMNDDEESQVAQAKQQERIIMHRKTSSRSAPNGAGASKVDLRMAENRSRHDLLAKYEGELKAGGDALESTRMPFLERYKKMTGTSGNNASVVRQISMKAETKEGGATKPFQSVLGSEEIVESPIALRLSGSTEGTGFPWMQRSKTTSDIKRSPSLNRLKPIQAHGNDGSISSIESAQAEQMKLGETALLTPSPSYGKLDDVTIAEEPSLDAAGMDRSRSNSTQGDMEIMSPELGGTPASSRRLSRRESSASSLIAPSDSISTPGIEYGKQPTLPKIPAGMTSKSKSCCQKCGMNLRGKRFVKRDGILLCEADWKELFLPKCRRCTLPIETSAISSSDGQLKGKWHRECFTCTTCSQPFSDTSFYVYDDKPYCQLHYHHVNGSLCAASTCKQPIEGPCLLTSGNQRYHPGHLHCDHKDRYNNHSCRDPMMDYYEVGNLKVCARHKDEALRHVNRMGGVRDEKGRMSIVTKAEKRKTRMINVQNGAV